MRSGNACSHVRRGADQWAGLAVLLGLLVFVGGCPPPGGGGENTPPTANDADVNVPFETATVVMLTANDPDMDDTLTFTVTALPENGTLTNENGDEIDATPAQLPGSTSRVTYAPDSGFTGEDSFTFTANDGTTDSGEGTISITVEPIDASRTFSEDTEVGELMIPDGDVNAIENDAVVTVTGDTQIDGMLVATSSRLVVRVDGNLTINGTLRSVDNSVEEIDGETPLGQQPVGIYIIVGNGEVTIGDTGVLDTNGNVVITDDDSVLMNTPMELFDEVEDVTNNDMPTLVPLPPDDPAFDDMDDPEPKVTDTVRQGGGMLPPVTIGGMWPPAGAPPVPGDVPVVIFRFNGMRDLNLDDWTVNGPPAPDRPAEDNSNDPGMDATGRRGRNGMRLNIVNNGGPINIVNTVTLNLTDGGRGQDVMGACADLTGGPGGSSGNFRMSASAGIDISNGMLVINPGAGGAGGDATVMAGPAGAAGCPGEDGGDSSATGGAGADNRKRVFVRGNVNGVANISIGPLDGGAGGNGDATGCDGGDGTACCDGGPGGSATANGGKGGDASMNISGFPIATGLVSGGAGGNATATGGMGGNGGPCKVGDGGDGGAGGAGTATAGDGGSGTNTGAGGSAGGDSGEANATGGDGGTGGDAGTGDPGDGGDAGMPTANAGAAGMGDTAGMVGETETTDGTAGGDGGDIQIIVFCLPMPQFVAVIEPGPIPPGEKGGPVLADDNVTPLGSAVVIFNESETANFQRGENPDHIGFQQSEVSIPIDSLELNEGMPGPIGGIQIETLGVFGDPIVDPLIVQAFDSQGELVGERAISDIPNFESLTGTVTLDASFDDVEDLNRIDIIAGPELFITVTRIYLIDP